AAAPHPTAAGGPRPRHTCRASAPRATPPTSPPSAPRACCTTTTTSSPSRPGSAGSSPASPRTAKQPPHPAARALSAGELAFVLQRHWAAPGLKPSADDFTDTEAIAAVHRITSGNFRLVQRLFAQITRVLAINGLSVISREAVETAQ